MYMLLPLLLVAGAAQIGIALVSLTIPRVLNWREQTRSLDPLTRHVFWTYAGYISATNLAMGLLSCAAPWLLLDGSTLARCVAGYAAAYWGVRLLLQLTVYGAARPRGRWYAAADLTFGLVFAYLTGVYVTIACALGPAADL